MFKGLFTLCLLLFVGTILTAQISEFTRLEFAQDSAQHTSIVDFNPYANERYKDTIIQELQIQSNFAQNKWLGRKIFYENLVHIKNEDYNLILNPLLNFSGGNDNNLENLTYVNRRGVQVRGNITDKFSFYTDFLETQAIFPKYVSDQIAESGVVPGQGIAKNFGKNGGKDYGIAQGFIDYTPNQYFGFQLGQGKNFIGDGYRSLLLSNNAFNYNYLRLTVNVWKLKYMVLYTQMKDIANRYPDGTFQNKYVTAHYLSYQVNRKLTLGFFESVTYADPDRTRGYDLSYLNPIIFYRPIEFALGSSGGNVILGLNTKYEITKKVHAYGQIALDELNLQKISEGDDWWANKFSWQIGVKSFDTFIPGLYVQTEINFARPFIYAHRNPQQSYTHYNQSLTHPLGSNFLESVSRIQYRNRRYFAAVEILIARRGLSRENENLGSDVLVSSNTRFQEFNNTFLQGDLARTTYIDAKVGYIFNPNYNLNLQLGVTNRDYQVENRSDLDINTMHIYCSLTTDLFQYYLDF
jgi:hypothetical protein